MQATYVKFQETHRDLLIEEARRRGCTMSDLVRQATIHFFHLPTDGPKQATTEQTSAHAGADGPRGGLGAAISGSADGVREAYTDASNAQEASS